MATQGDVSAPAAEPGSPLMAARTVDIACFGARTPGRERFLAGAASQLWEWRTDIRLGASATVPVADLTRTRILVDVVGPGDPGVPDAVLLDAIAGGCVVVTNRPGGLPPFVAGTELVVSPAEYLAEQAVALALDEDRRGRMAVAALAALGTHAWTAPAPTPPAAPEPRPRVRDAARAVLRTLLPTPANDEATVRRLTELQTTLKRAYVHQVETTRGIDRAMVLAGGDDADAVMTTATAAYADTVPVVTVVVAVTHDVRATRAALASVSAATSGHAATPAMHDGEPIVAEVVLVGGEADVVGSLVDELAGLPLVSVRRLAGGGPVAELDAGVAAARAPFVLPLAAGQELYPNAVRVLLDRLERAPADVIASYGIVERFDGDGSVGVDGAIEWDVDLLLRERCLDTIGMFRTDALTQLGGACTEAALEGWTTHDLWLATAQRGWRAVATGVVVGRSPVVPSGDRIDLIDATTTWLHLYERHPRLPWPS